MPGRVYKVRPFGVQVGAMRGSIQAVGVPNLLLRETSLIPPLETNLSSSLPSPPRPPNRLLPLPNLQPHCPRPCLSRQNHRTARLPARRLLHSGLSPSTVPTSPTARSGISKRRRMRSQLTRGRTAWRYDEPGEAR